VLNLGSGRQIAIKDLADQVLAADGKDDRMVTYAPGRPGEQRHVQADITRAGRVLGWRPRTPFAEGFARTAAWARGVMEEDSAGAAPR
jgi:UDP-glucose 4-epimerase